MDTGQFQIAQECSDGNHAACWDLPGHMCDCCAYNHQPHLHTPGCCESDPPELLVRAKGQHYIKVKDSSDERGLSRD
jgi:hypothetical protein